MDARTMQAQKDGKTADAAKRDVAVSGMRRMARSPWVRAFVAAAMLGGAACGEAEKDLPNVSVRACGAEGCTEIKAHGNLRVKKGDRVMVVMEVQEDSICHAYERHDVDHHSRDYSTLLGDTASIKCNVVEEKKPKEEVTPLRIGLAAGIGFATLVTLVMCLLGRKDKTQNPPGFKG